MNLLILPLFLFTLPIYISYYVRDTFGLFMFTITMGISIASQSNIDSSYQIGKKSIRPLIIYLYGFGCYHFFQLVTRFHYVITFILTIYHLLLFIKLDDSLGFNRKNNFLHAVFYVSCIITITFIRYYK